MPAVRQHDLFSDTASHAARDDALAAITARANTWMERAIGVIALLPKGWLGLGEDIRFHVERVIGPPHHSNVTGALVKKAADRKLIERTGRRRHMRLVRSHARLSDEWQRL